MAINKIKTIDIHDAPVKEINFQFEKKSLLIVVEIWDDDLSIYKENKLYFKGVLDFSTNDFSVESFQVEDLSSIEINEIQPKGYEIKVIFNLGHSKPVWVLSFSCLRINYEE